MIDLHTHSTASDGTDSPEQLLRKAHARGLKALALTDHDTLAGLEEAERTAKSLSMDFIRGCEVSTRVRVNNKEESMHILGLWLPRECDELENFLNAARARREQRNLRMMDKLRALGFEVDLDELREKAKGSIGRPHMADLLVEKGYAHDRTEAFLKYLGKNGKAYVAKDSPAPEEVVELLSRQGAMVFIAHPLLGDAFSPSWLAKRLPGLKERGLCGLEALHSAQNKHKSEVLEELARENGLQISGGSDYHGTGKQGLQLGFVAEDRDIPDEIYMKLLEYRAKNNLDN